MYKNSYYCLYIRYFHSNSITPKKISSDQFHSFTTFCHQSDHLPTVLNFIWLLLEVYSSLKFAFLFSSFFKSKPLCLIVFAGHTSDLSDFIVTLSVLMFIQPVKAQLSLFGLIFSYIGTTVSWLTSFVHLKLSSNQEYIRFLQICIVTYV